MQEVTKDFSTILKLSPEEAKNICRLGQGEKCCAFLVATSKGFECIRMDYPANTTIFTRLEEGKMNAKGTGGWKGCPWEGYI